MLKNSIFELKFVFVGEGVMEELYRKKVELFGVFDIVWFYGFCWDIYEFI